MPALLGGIVLAFAVGLSGGQVQRRRRAARRTAVAKERPAPAPTPSLPVRPAPPPPEPVVPEPKPVELVAPAPPRPTAARPRRSGPRGPRILRFRAAPSPPPPEPAADEVVEEPARARDRPRDHRGAAAAEIVEPCRGRRGAGSRAEVIEEPVAAAPSPRPSPTSPRRLRPGRSASRPSCRSATRGRPCAAVARQRRCPRRPRRSARARRARARRPRPPVRPRAAVAGGGRDALDVRDRVEGGLPQVDVPRDGGPARRRAAQVDRRVALAALDADDRPRAADLRDDRQRQDPRLRAASRPAGSAPAPAPRGTRSGSSGAATASRARSTIPDAVESAEPPSR